MNFVILSTLADIVGMPTEVVADFFLVVSHQCNKAYDRQMLTANEMFRDRERNCIIIREINNYVYLLQRYYLAAHPDFSTKKAELILISWL